MRGCLRVREHFARVSFFDDVSAVHEDQREPSPSAREAHLVRDDEHRHPLVGSERDEPAAPSPDQLGGRVHEVGSSNSIMSGFMHSARRDRDALLLPAGAGVRA